MNENCNDCKLPLTFTDVDGIERTSHQDEHPGLCCDCFDESLGVPSDQRIRLRP